MQLINQSAYLIGAFVIVFLWQALSFEGMTIPFIGLLVVVYLYLSRRGKNTEGSGTSSEQLSIGILTTLILLLIFATGGLESPIFFLLYFIPFAIAFVLMPEVVFIYIVATFLLFLSPALMENVTQNLIKLGSIALITPLAYFFGKEYRAVSRHQQKDEEIAKRISSDAANVLQDQKNLPEQDKAQLADIIKESEELEKV